MHLTELRAGDSFVEGTQADYEAMSSKEKYKNTVKFDRYLEPCRTSPERVHVKTSRGDWCIPKVSPVVRIHVKPKEKAA